MESETTKRPWGSFTRFTNNEPSTVKILHIDKGEEFSLQYHTHRQEFWKILKGNPEVIVGDKTEYPHEGEEFVIEPHVNHRIFAPNDDVTVLEISTGQFDENDIVRLEDKYNRV
ncbi:MAG: mannose-1-phosphate guanylyltransferase/mannose-6-phosphate isomerase [Parcubacteria group bacterium Gr01-1014_46]|nr:MAG: mannose-1-phosphate guanylyltransferase/mannose-6-phosphate isomerase [Parcubacteria group bacterium Gr01-1014_46]